MLRSQRVLASRATSRGEKRSSNSNSRLPSATASPIPHVRADVPELCPLAIEAERRLDGGLRSTRPHPVPAGTAATWAARGGDFTRFNLAWLNWRLKGDMGATGKGIGVGSSCAYCSNSAWEVSRRTSRSRSRWQIGTSCFLMKSIVDRIEARAISCTYISIDQASCRVGAEQKSSDCRGRTGAACGEPFNALGHLTIGANNQLALPCVRDCRVREREKAKGHRWLRSTRLVVGDDSTGGSSISIEWQSTTRVAPLPLGAVSSSAQDVNDCGDVLGTLFRPDGRTRSYLWQPARASQ